MILSTHNYRVGILSYNHPELTERTLHSCLKIRPNIPLTLLHNGSEDRWVQQLKQKFPNIEHLVLTKNQGFTGGANTLLAAIFEQSPWCLFLTNDVQLLELEPPTTPALVAPLIYRRKIGVIDSMGGRFYPKRGDLEHCRSAKDFYRVDRDSFPYIPGTACWLHRDVFQQTGTFDLSLGTYWEDVDYSMRLQRLGLPLHFCDQTKLLHSVGKTCHKKKFYTSYLFQRNKYYVTLKYNPTWLSRFLFKGRYWSDWCRGFLRALKRRDHETLRYKVNLFRELVFKTKPQFTRSTKKIT